MSLIKTDNNRIVFKKPDSMMLVPYVYNSTIGDYVLGDDVYDISAIIGDSTVIEQSEGETTIKENEFKSSPLLEMHSNGRYKFTANCIDLQNKVLKSVFGAMTSGIDGLVAMEDDFSFRYALVKIHFDSPDVPDIIMPKVSLNSRVYIQQLRTSTGQGNISGVPMRHDSAVLTRNESEHKLVSFSVNSTGGSSYSPSTPLLFVPSDMKPVFLRQKRLAASRIYSLVDFENGTVSNVYLNTTTGTWSSTDGGGGDDSGDDDDDNNNSNA